MIEQGLLTFVIAANLAGFTTFVTVYFFMASPLKHYMGRRVFIFMALLMLSFAYVILGQAFESIFGREWFLRGWILILGLIAIVVWWATAILIKYQLAARREKIEETEE